MVMGWLGGRKEKTSPGALTGGAGPSGDSADTGPGRKSSGVIKKKIGKYNVISKIGGGGFGTVYEGFDPLIQRKVAIKTCEVGTPELRARTFQEDAEEYVRENPTRAIFTALGIGFVMGLVFRR